MKRERERESDSKHLKCSGKFFFYPEYTCLYVCIVQKVNKIEKKKRCVFKENTCTHAYSNKNEKPFKKKNKVLF